jgi:hypothetical protein
LNYIGNPVLVTAEKIVSVSTVLDDGSVHLALGNGENFTADKTMTARYVPVEGDYLVTQEDGYRYLNPKDVFERKYSYDPPCGETLPGNASHPTLICGERKSDHTPEAAKADVGMDHVFVKATFD